MSMNLADIYGITSRATESPSTDVAPGPNPGAVAASAPVGRAGQGGVGAAASWVGFVGLLVLLRVFIELGGKVD